MRSGEFERAAVQAAAGESAARDTELRCRLRLLRVESLLLADKRHDVDKLLAEPIQPVSPEYKVRHLLFRSRRALATSNFASAMSLAREAQKLVDGLQRRDLQAEVEIQIGMLLARQRRDDEAEAMLQQALAHAVEAGDTFRQASAKNNLGLLRMLLTRYEEGIALFQDAAGLFEKAGAPYYAKLMRGNMASGFGQLGKLEDAVRVREDLLQSQRPGVTKSNMLGEMGTLYLTDEPAKAIPFYRQAYDMAQQFGARPEAARWAGNLVLALSATGDWAGAEKALAEALALGPESRSRAYLDLNAADIALRRGRVDEARASYEKIIASSARNPRMLWGAYSGLADATMAAGDSQSATKAFESALQVIEGAWSDLNANENKITFLSRLIRFYQAYVQALMAQGQTEKALSVADRSRARVLAQRLSREIPHSATDYRAVARKSGSIWLCYWLAPTGSFLWVVTPKEVRAIPLPPAAEIERLVRDYRGFIEQSMRDPMASPNEAGKALYEKLIAPALPLLPKDADIVIVPDGALHQLSFDTLPVYTETPHYLVNDFAMAIAPSLGVYRGSTRQPAGSREALIIGNPLSSGPEYPALPHAAEEIVKVQKRLSAMETRVVSGEAARPDVWSKEDPGKYAIIHIAAHAEANEKSPLQSAIILSPKPAPQLFARDMVDVRLRADLVTLSAGRSSGARAYRGEGLVGFAWTFLQAGARGVIAGLWDVSDESTLLLMDHLYEGISRKEPPVRALRNARIALQKTSWSKPYYWGPFQYYLQ